MELPVIVQFVNVAAPPNELQTPAPPTPEITKERSAVIELPVIEQLLREMVPVLNRPAPEPPKLLTYELLVRLQSVNDLVPALNMPAPWLALPLAMVSFEIVAVPPLLTWITRLRPPPLIVTPAAGPVMDMDLVVLPNTSGDPVNVI